MATNTIGAKIVLEGEADYKNAISNINQSQKELRSELKLVTAEFSENQNSVEALTAKQEVLTKQIETHKEKIEVYTQALEASTEKQEKQKTALEEASSKYEKAQKELEDLTSSTTSSTEEIDKQKEVVAKLKTELDKAASGYESSEKKTSTWQTSLNNANADLIKMEGNLENTEKYLEEATNATDKCATSIDEYGKKVKDAGEESEEFGDKSQEAINALATAIVAAGVIDKLEDVAEALKECADVSKEVESSFKTTSVLFGDVDVDVQKLYSDVRTLTQDGTSATEVYETMYQAMSAGIDATEDMENVVTATDVAIKGAIVGLTDATSTIDLLTTIQNSYNMSADSTNDIMDQLVTTQNKGKTTIDELSSSMGKTISSASAYNISLENVNASYISLTKNGIATSEAGTYMTSMFSELGDSGSDVAKIITDKTGKSFGELMDDGYSLADVLEILDGEVNGNSEALMNLWSSQEAGKASNAVVKQGLEDFNDTIVELTESAGTLDEAYETMTDTTEMAEKRFTQSITNLQQAIGDTLNPSLKEFYENGMDVVDWSTEFVEKNPETVACVIAFTTATAATVGGLTTLTVVIPAVTTAMTAMNAAIAANPAGLVAIGVIALASATAAYLATVPQQESDVEILAEKHETLKEEIEASRQEYLNLKDTINENKTSNEAMMQSLINLNAVEEKTATQKQQIANLVALLNEAGLDVTYEQEADALSKTNSEMEDYLKILSEQESYNADVEELNRLLSERSDIESQLAEETELYNDLLKQQTEYSEKQEEILAGGLPAANSEYTAILTNLNMEIEESNDRINEANELLDENKSQYEELEGTCNNYTDAVEENKNALEESASVTFEYRDKLYEVAVASQETADAITVLETEYLAAKDAAYESISSQVGLFDELVTASDLTVEQMKSNLDSQTESFNQYSDDLQAAAELMNSGVSPEFEAILENIMAMGMDGAGYLHELVESASEDTEAFNEVMQSFAEMEDAKELLSESMAEINIDYAERLEELTGIQLTENEEQIVNAENLSNELVTINATGNDAIVTDTSASLEEINTAIITATPIIATQMNTLVEGMITTTNSALGKLEGQTPVFYTIGMDIANDLASGIADGESVVATALSGMINNAVESIEISGIAEKINIALGTAMG